MLLLMLLVKVPLALLLHLLEFHLLLAQVILVLETHEKLLGLDELGIVRGRVVLLHLLKFLEGCVSKKRHITEQ